MKLKELKRGSMKILQKIVAAVCAVAVTATMTSPISIGDNSARAEEVQLASNTTETVDSSAALTDEETPMSGKCGDNLTWVLDDEGTLTISGTGEMYNYDVNYPNLSPWNDRTDIKSVLIKNGVTGIGEYTFSGCTSLTGVTISDSVTHIGWYAFANCTSLKKVTIPNGVTDISSGAFRGCASLIAINVNSDNNVYCSDNGVLFYKSKTTLIKYPNCDDRKNYKIPDSVNRIGDGAFESCTNLTSVTIPDSVNYIEEIAFQGCTSLKSVTIPNSVTSIGTYAFSDCTSLTSVTIPDSVTYIAGGTFCGCTSLKNVTIPDSVSSIEGNAFEGCASLKNVTIPNSVTNIGNNVFGGCTGLTNVAIPNCVSYIGNNVFTGCASLTSVTIPDSVTSIYSYAFRDCTNLKDVYYTGSEEQWQKIYIDYYYNEYLTKATIHYNSTGVDPVSESSGEKVTFNGHTYQMFRLDDVTGKEAISYCNKIGGYMAHINDAEENDFLSNYIRESNIGYAYFGYTDEEVEGDWKWVDGKNSSYTNWGKNEPNNSKGEEHYAIINQDGSWNDGGFEGDSAKGRAFVICEWENEEATEQNVGNVRFLSSYDPETGKVRFDNSSTHIGLDYTLSDTIDKELAASLVGKYVLTEINSDSLAVTDLKPVDSKIGTISAIDKTASTITIDGEVYPLSRDDSVLTLFADQQIGKTVLFHTYNNTIVALNSIEEKTGKLESWDSTEQEVTIGGKSYPTNGLTDMAFVTDIEQMLGRKVKFTYVNDSYTPILAVELYDENNNDHSEFEADIYHANWLTTKSTSTDILKDETPSSILQDPTSEFVNEGWNAFSKILSLPSSISTLSEFAMGITQQDMYEALILDALQADSNSKSINSAIKDNEKLAKEFVSDLIDAITTKYQIDASNEEGFISNVKAVGDDFFDKFTENWVETKHPKLTAASDYFKNVSKFIKAVGKIDDISNYAQSCLILAEIDNETIELLSRAYSYCTNSKDFGTFHPMTSALHECIDMYETGKDGLWESIKSGTIKVGGKWGQEYLVDKLWSKIKESVGLKNPNVAIILAGISAGQTVTNFLCKSDSAAEKYIKMEYITHIESVFNNIYNNCVSSFKANKDLESARLFLAAVRLEFQLRDTDCETAYKYADELDQAFLSKLASWLGDTTQKNLKNKISTIQNAYKTSYWGAETLWVNYLEDDYPNSGLYEKYSYLLSDDAIKSFFNLKKEVKAACPVNVYIYDEEDHLVAYVEDDVVSCSVDDLVIAQDGDEKIIRFYDNANYRVEYSGYDEGTMDIVITEFDDTQIARTVNYNNLPVTSSQIYSSTIDNQMFKPYRLTDNTDNSDVTYDYDSMQSTSKHKLTIISGTVEQNGETLIETTAAKGERLSLSAFAPEGYTFVKWQSTGTSSVIYDALAKNTTMIMPDEDVTLTAVINPPEGTYMISFDFNNEQEEYTYRRTDTNGKLNDLPTATCNGYTFDGWFTTADDGNKITTETVFTADTTVYAHWTKNTGDSEGPGIPDTSDSSNSDDNGTDSDTSSDSGANVDSGSSTGSEVSSGSSSDDTSNNSKPSDSTSGTDSDDLDTNNPSTGVTVAIIPILLAAGASVVVFRKKDGK